jgi:N-methylhydantoinase A
LIEDVRGGDISLVAVDVGGTITDLIAVHTAGLTALKVPSTPHEPEKGVLDAISGAGASGATVVHGSTVATNAILERKGSRTAFIGTEGFSDIIEIGRQERPDLYTLAVTKPRPLAGKPLRFEAPERVTAGGTVLKELTRKDARELSRAVARSGARSAAVCLLFSFERPEHEEMISEELAALGIETSLSCRILPEYREYERASTTLINAYIAPVMGEYLDRLESSLRDGGKRGGLRLMHSAGGTVSARLARSRPADLILSGPAGGAIAARWLAGSLGIDKAVSFDMGGTSTDVSLIDQGLTITRDTRISGLPVALPMVDIHTIGAGGGSIAFLDRAGVLKVGPESAGADPGPACYGRGKSPTVTDANVSLGRLEPAWFLGGTMPLFPDRSAGALKELAYGRNAVKVAEAILEIALSHTEGAVKKISLERGHDPRDCALIAFGGAGPMHACELAQRLEMPRVIVPVHPGLFSSVGMLLAEPGRDHTRSILCVLDEKSVGALSRSLEELRSQATTEMRKEGFKGVLSFRTSLDMRYRGQSHEVSVPAPRMDLQEIRVHFEQAFASEFGYSRPDQEIEVVNMRLSCRAPRQESPLQASPPTVQSRGEPLAEKEMHFDGRPCTGRVYSRWDIVPSRPVSGPALIVQDDTTTVVPPGWRASVDMMGNLELEASS